VGADIEQTQSREEIMAGKKTSSLTNGIGKTEYLHVED
jgi:hypothetical protein